jgi:hypothetical protein
MSKFFALLKVLQQQLQTGKQIEEHDTKSSLLSPHTLQARPSLVHSVPRLHPHDLKCFWERRWRSRIACKQRQCRPQRCHGRHPHNAAIVALGCDWREHWRRATECCCQHCAEFSSKIREITSLTERSARHVRSRLPPGGAICVQASLEAPIRPARKHVKIHRCAAAHLCTRARAYEDEQVRESMWIELG